MKGKRVFIPSYLIRLCADKAAFEVKFPKKLCLNMESVKKAVETSKRYEMMLYTPYIIILKDKRGPEITFSKDGRMLIKKVSDKDEADAVARNILRIVFRDTTC